MNKTKNLLSKIGMILVVLLVGVNTVNAQFCPGNRFTNGDFTNLIVLNSDNLPDDEDIHKAEGWFAPWGGVENSADLARGGTTQGGGVVVPTPNSGNYGGMWLRNSTNLNESAEGTSNRREAMYNKLTSPITHNSGWYSFSFDIARGMNATSTTIAIYGVSNPTNITIAKPSKHFSPSNLELFGQGNVIKLGTINTPSNLTNTWMPQSLSFSTLNWTKDITHILITSDDLLSTYNSTQYINFDNFCMKTTVDPTETPVEFNECNCMPSSVYSKVGSLFKVEPIGENTLANLTYKLKYVPSQELQNLSNSWDTYIRNLYSLAPNTEVLIHQFILFETDVNGNETGSPLETRWISDKNGGWPTNPTTWFNSTLYKNKKYIIVHGAYYSHLVPFDKQCGWKEARAFSDHQIGGNMRLMPIKDNGRMMKRPIQTNKK